jgi:hypothetical protein
LKSKENPSSAVKRKSSPRLSRNSSKLSIHKSKVTKESPYNKENYENRLKTLKKTQIRHYRNESQV